MKITKIGRNAIMKFINPIKEVFDNGEVRTYKYGVIVNYDENKDYTSFIDCDLTCESYQDAKLKAWQWQ